MQNQYINELLNIPELHVNQILSICRDELHIEAVPVACRQCCPICLSAQHVIRKGTNALKDKPIIPRRSFFDKGHFLALTGMFSVPKPAHSVHERFIHSLEKDTTNE
jgi:transposase